ncbi:MAG: ABC transporter permease [Acidobacteriota bacterium]
MAAPFPLLRRAFHPPGGRSSAAGLRFPVTVLGLLAALSLLAPLVANNKPLAVQLEGRLLFPAFRDLFPLPLFLRPDEAALALQKDPRWFGPGGGGRQRARWVLLPPIPYSPYETSLDRIHEPPSRNHPMGCDDVGRDVAARIVHGTKVSLLTGVLSMFLALLVGVSLGALGGFAGGAVDRLFVSPAIEVMLCFPTFFFILTVTAVTDPRYLNLWSVILVIGLTSWAPLARFARAEFLRLRSAPFVEAARALGAGPFRQALRHILPNASGPLAVNAAFGAAGAVLAEAALSFLGVGIQPPEPSWGNVMSLVVRHWSDWWLGLFPGAALFLTVMAYNRLGEALEGRMGPGGPAPG